MGAQLVVCLLLVFCLYLNASGRLLESSLNVPQILLPFVSEDSSPATYPLTAAKGCYRWKSTRPEVADVARDKVGVRADGTERLCTSSVTVVVRSNQPGEDMSVIFAEEEGSGHVLRCDAFVHAIERIEIATTTRELLVGEAPEVFEVHAYDKQGNLFSSLGSQKFEWTLLCANKEKKVDPESILKLLWFRNSPYEARPEVYNLEDQGYRGSIALVEAISIGEVTITAKLTSQEYKNVAPASVKVTVIDNIVLIPYSDVFIMVNTSVKYTVQQLCRGSVVEVSFPSDQYGLKLSNSDVADLDENSASVFGKCLGSTKVVVFYKNMLELSSLRQPTASIFVVEPGYIKFSILPHEIWVLEKERSYEVAVLVFDHQGNKILLEESHLLSTIIPTDFLEIVYQSSNNSYFHVKARNIGTCVLKATLEGVKNTKTGEIHLLLNPVKGSQSLLIYDSIIIFPKILIFPFEPNEVSNPGKTYNLNASGGSGKYVWVSSNGSVATVNQVGVLSVANILGTASVRASDARNVLHFDEMIVKVLAPIEMRFALDGPREAVINTELKLSLSIAGELVPGSMEEFTDCRQINVSISFDNPSIFRLAGKESSDLPPKPGCRYINVIALQKGHTELKAKYEYGQVALYASVVIAAFDPLQVPSGALSSVAVGSSQVVVVHGGPEPWVLNRSGFFETLRAEEEDWVVIRTSGSYEAVGKRSLHSFEVTCLSHGEQILHVEIGNHPTTTNTEPKKSAGITRFSCSYPARVELLPLISMPMVDGVKMSIRDCQDADLRIPVLNSRQLKVNLLAFDARGYRFYNLSSFAIEWSTSNELAARFISRSTLFETQSEALSELGSQFLNAFQLLDLSSLKVPVTIKVNVVKEFNAETTSLSAEMHMLLVSAPVISPDNVALFGDNENQVDLSITGGSGHFKIKASDVSLAAVEAKGKGAITVKPFAIGHLTLTAVDMCLDGHDAPHASIYISDVDRVSLSVADQVQVGHAIPAFCHPLDKQGRSLAASRTSKAAVTLKTSAIHLNAKRQDKDNEENNTAAWFELQGISVGMGSVSCSARQLSGNIVSSRSKDVQVFPPLRLDPHKLVLIVGSVFQVRSHGGPHTSGSLVFAIDNATVAEVNHFGLVTAKALGKAVLTGTAQLYDAQRGSSVVISQCTVSIEVLSLQGFKIYLPSRNLASGSEIGIRAVSLNGDGPLMYALTWPAFNFFWSSSNSEVAVIESMHYKAGVSLDNDFRATLRLLKPGHATVHMEVQIGDGLVNMSPGAKLSDDVHIQVFEKLQVVFPSDGMLLLPYNVQAQILTNRDGVAEIKYATSSCVSEGKEHLVDVSPSGLITTGSHSGTATVVVTALEEFRFNQTVLVKVEVKPVADLTLVSLAPVVHGYHRPAFPLGMTVLFAVTLHDNFGRLFTAVKVPLQHRLSRYDVVDVVPSGNENFTYAVRTMSVGEAIIKVELADVPSIADYVRVTVQHGISPSSVQITHGMMVCFKLTSSSHAHVGKWTVTGAHLEVHPRLGIAIAASVGDGIVHYSDSVLSTYVEVKVIMAKEIQIDASPNTLVLRHSPGKVDTIPLKILSLEHAAISLTSFCEGSQLDSSSLNLTVPFHCRAAWLGDVYNISLSDVVSLRPGYLNGAPVCIFVAKELPRSTTNMLISYPQLSISLKAVLQDRFTLDEITSNPVRIKFLPDVLLEPVLPVMFTEDSGAELLVLHGHPDILSQCEVTVDDASFKLIPANRPGIITQARFEITADDQLLSLNSTIRVKCLGRTGEFQTPVSVRRKIRNPSSPFASSSDLQVAKFWWLLVFTSFIAALLALALGYHLLFRDRSPVQVTVASPTAALPSPSHFSGSPLRKSNPLTPPNTVPTRALFSVSQ